MKNVKIKFEIQNINKQMGKIEYKNDNFLEDKTWLELKQKEAELYKQLEEEEDCLCK